MDQYKAETYYYFSEHQLERELGEPTHRGLFAQCHWAAYKGFWKAGFKASTNNFNGETWGENEDDVRLENLENLFNEMVPELPEGKDSTPLDWLLFSVKTIFMQGFRDSCIAFNGENIHLFEDYRWKLDELFEDSYRYMLLIVNKEDLEHINKYRDAMNKD